MLELAKLIHEVIGIESPRLFVGLFAVIGLLLFGGVGYVIDKGYRVRLQEQAKATEVAAPRQAPARKAPASITAEEKRKANPPINPEEAQRIFNNVLSEYEAAHPTLERASATCGCLKKRAMRQ